jgi:hypothetical protein
VNEQLSFFDPAAGRALREDAIERVTAAAPEEWKMAALDAIEACAGRQSTLTTDDVWRELHERGVEPPPERRAMAGPIRRAESLGLIFKTDRFVPSKLPWAHRRNTQVWKSSP